jgi:hypothetical protein
VVTVLAAMPLGCRRASAPNCDDVPTTADGCRERCHDRGEEMAFFRADSAAYVCDAICTCTQ